MRKYQRYHLFLCFPPVFTPWLLYSFMPSVSPSPTVSMLRVTRVSRYSFLLSLSMATVSRSSGEGFNTLPPHSTCKGQFSNGSTRRAACVKMSRVKALHCRWQRLPLSSTGEGTSRSSCRSSPCLHRWRRSQRFQPRRQTKAHLKQRMKNGGSVSIRPPGWSN